MKKLALFLALVLCLAPVAMASCTGGGDQAETTPAATDATTVVTTAEQTKADTTAQSPDTTAPVTTGNPIPELLDAKLFTLDGDLKEWTELGTHTVSVIGDASDTLYNSGNKKAIFYVALTTEGLYLACDAYHDLYTTGSPAANWWLNSNFEFFIGSAGTQYFVYATGMDQECGTSANVDQAVMNTQLVDEGYAYHTITECFVSNANLNESDILENSIEIGVAWKTVGDYIFGGACTAQDGADEYWVPLNTWPGNHQLLAAPTGIFYYDEYFE